MTEQTNQDCIKALAQAVGPFTLYDNQNATGVYGTGGTQQTNGLAIRGEQFRVVQSAANAACVLPSITGLDGSGVIHVVNSSPNSINVGAAAGDKVANVATTGTFTTGIQAVAAGSSCFFVAASPTSAGGGPPVAASTNFNNWHVFPGTGA
jgi:hypothetical protein